MEAGQDNPTEGKKSQEQIQESEPILFTHSVVPQKRYEVKSIIYTENLVQTRVDSVLAASVSGDSYQPSSVDS